METGFIYLASASPRRAELLGQLGVEFRVCPADVEEAAAPGEPPADYVARTALAKACAVRATLPQDAAPVLGADTIVVCDGLILGKPDGREAALGMLAALGGREHEVLSAVAVADAHGTRIRVSASKVRFRATTARERAAYCDTAEPFDKAGAYGIQGFAAAFIEHLDGSYSGVMGLPLFETAQLLDRYAMPAWLHAVADAAADTVR